jgi:hypothetical protein
VLNSLIIDVAIGLVFVFATTAAATSAATEMVARFLGLRGDYLLRGLRALVDGDTKSISPTATKDLLQTIILRNQGRQQREGLALEEVAAPDLGKRKQLPAYIPARSFSRAVVDLLIPDAKKATTLTDIRAAVDKMPPGGVLKESLQALLKNAGDDIDEFRRSVEEWYDDHMARVSGWYKRQVRWVSLGIGFVLVLVVNINTVTIARALYTDEALRESVVTTAVQSSNCGQEKPVDCLREIRTHIGALRGAGLPIGWGTVPACVDQDCNLLERLGFADPARGGQADVWLALWVLLGFVITAVALVPGARFWFDLLNRLGSLRSTGPKPASSNT